MYTPTGASTNPKHFDLNKNLNAFGTLIIYILFWNEIENWTWILKLKNKNWKLKLEITPKLLLNELIFPFRSLPLFNVLIRYMS